VLTKGSKLEVSTTRMNSLLFIFCLLFSICVCQNSVNNGDGDQCQGAIFCNDCTNSGVTGCYFCRSNILKNPLAVCVNQTNRDSGLNPCSDGWLSVCFCEEYPTCDDCAVNIGCGWCKGRGCLLGQYQPSNSSGCGQANYAYGSQNCPGKVFLLGVSAGAFAGIIALIVVCLCIIIPVGYVECRKRQD